LRPASRFAARDAGAGVQVGQPVALVEVGVLLGDDVEVAVQGVPGPALDVLAEARRPVLDGQVVGLRDVERRA
jgi:hypothetical protein